jgi:hypothetical protein
MNPKAKLVPVAARTTVAASPSSSWRRGRRCEREGGKSGEVEVGGGRLIESTKEKRVEERGDCLALGRAYVYITRT